MNSAFIYGFIKRAEAYGLSEKQAFDALKNIQQSIEGVGDLMGRTSYNLENKMKDLIAPGKIPPTGIDTNMSGTTNTAVRIPDSMGPAAPGSYRDLLRQGMTDRMK